MWWRTSNCSPLLIYRLWEDERLSWPGWLTYSGWLTHISGHPPATGRVQDGERTLARDWRSTAEPCGPTFRLVNILGIEFCIDRLALDVFLSWLSLDAPCRAYSPQTTHLHRAISWSAVSAFLQLYLTSAASISFSRFLRCMQIMAYLSSADLSHVHILCLYFCRSSPAYSCHNFKQFVEVGWTVCTVHLYTGFPSLLESPGIC